MALRSSLVGLGLFLVAAVPFGVVACSASGDDPAADLTSGTGNTDPNPDAAPTATPLPEASPEEDTGTPDASKDAGKDAAKDASGDGGDASVDAGPPAPNPGDACGTIDQIFERSCGACGKQQAICLPGAGGAGAVSEYSICAGELAGGCVPGTVEDAACGNCGTQKRTCTKYCAWTATACTGEPVNSCVPTKQDYSTAGCPTPGTYRTRSCGATCKWSDFALSCQPLHFKLDVSGTAGETVSAIYALSALQVDKRLTGTCPSGTLSTTTNHPYVYVELANPTSQTITASAWNTATSPTGVVIDTLMAWYASADRPAGDAARKACTKGMNDACPSGLPCGDSKWAGLTGTNAITIPPLSSVTLFFGSYYAAGSSSVSEGDVKLVVRTDSAL